MTTTSPRPGRASGLDRVLDALSFVCKLLSGTAIVVLTLIFGWLVWGRYVMNDTPTWVEQVALLLVMLITFLGAAVGVRENTHLGVSYFREIVPSRVRTMLMVISHIFMAIFGAVLAWNGYKLAALKWESSIPLIGVSEGWRAVPITACGILVLLFSLGHLVAIARGERQELDLSELAE